MPCVQPAPFLKWAGGKRQLLPELLRRVPSLRSGRYFEPFVGGGALFFALQQRGLLGRRGARLSDINADLINCYLMVRDQVEPLIQLLSRHRNEETYYYAVRAQDPRTLDPVQRAARLIYLNKTCFNGLFRENRHGLFNVPFGHYARPRFCDPEALRAASYALRGVAIEHSSFEEVEELAQPGDFVYFDPPYVPLSRTARFVQYSAGGFGPERQERLARCVATLAARGVSVLVSNSATPLVRGLYAGFLVEEVQANRAINSRGDRRGKVCELLIRAGPHARLAAAARPVAPQGVEPRTLRV
ncbi:MAG: DNA adenine methylase [Myxococcota bacterium]|nr:DNA adenine methylase [Myxococcota bacterium]